MGENIFTDGKAGQWYTEAIAWAAANEIVGGVGNNCFAPDDTITREPLGSATRAQVATILMRYIDTLIVFD